jgi:hypothetical protein
MVATKRKFSEIILQKSLSKNKSKLMAPILNTRRHGQNKFNNFGKSLNYYQQVWPGDLLVKKSHSSRDLRVKK